MNKRSEDIRDFILTNIETHASDIAPLVASNFGVSRQSAHNYVAKEVQKGTLIKVGNTRWTRYFLAGGKHIEFTIKIKPGLAEDSIWTRYVKPMLLEQPGNVQNICNYGFTEIINNAIDHSEGTSIYVSIDVNDVNISIKVMDNGIGIFQKIQRALGLDSIRESILHLSKGKFTTDPTKHTGEGIFFTSRIFDKFGILSDDMFYTFSGNDWFLSSEKEESFGKGTFIQMQVNKQSEKTTKQVMDEYADQDIGFMKTVVAVALSADPNDPHVSRSQAKRLLMGLEKFKKIILDFNGVVSVGQAFVDEVFRVFKNAHPGIAVQYVNANSDVEQMIKRGLNSGLDTKKDDL